jgi:plasmid stabilization system protein ParE
LADGDGDVLDRVVIVDVQVAATLHVEVEEAVAREQFEHVIEERHARADPRVAAPVERERDAHVRLLRLPPHGGRARARRAGGVRLRVVGR